MEAAEEKLFSVLLKAHRGVERRASAIIKYCLKSNYSDRNLELLERQIIIRNAVQSPLNLT